MSLELSNSPEKPEIKIWFDNVVRIDASGIVTQITMEDFCSAMYYVLTNTPILKDDPRLKFLEVVKELVLVPDTNKNFIGWSEHKSLRYKGKDCFSLHYPANHK